MDPIQIELGLLEPHGPGDISGNQDEVVGSDEAVPMLSDFFRVPFPSGPEHGHALVGDAETQMKIANGPDAHALQRIVVGQPRSGGHDNDSVADIDPISGIVLLVFVFVDELDIVADLDMLVNDRFLDQAILADSECVGGGAIVMEGRHV